MSLEKIFRSFFSNHFPQGVQEPFLLAFSGGPDSSALFHLLLQEKIPFHALHINHGWRQESDSEQESLVALCLEKKIPLHTKRLSFTPEDKNLEDKARQERLALYKMLVTQENYRGVLLGHHADDQAETLLKRIFEGASLPKLKGLTKISSVEGISLYRPLLGATKKMLLEWLHAHNISYFTDSTNYDKRFLRTRCREDLLPLLSKNFGKAVVPALVRLGEAASELEAHVELLVAPYRNQVVRQGEQIELQIEIKNRSLFEIKAVIKDFFYTQGVILSAHGIEALVQHLTCWRGKKRFRFGKKGVLLDKRGQFFSITIL